MCLVDCEDIYVGKKSDCESWAKNGQCEKNSAFMMNQCKKACTGCSGIYIDFLLCSGYSRRGDARVWVVVWCGGTQAGVQVPVGET